MKLKYDIMFAEIEGEIVGLPVRDNLSDDTCLIKVNEPAKDIIRLLKEEISSQALTAKMLERYDADEEQLRADIAAILAALESNDLLEK